MLTDRIEEGGILLASLPKERLLRILARFSQLLDADAFLQGGEVDPFQSSEVQHFSSRVFEHDQVVLSLRLSAPPRYLFAGANWPALHVAPVHRFIHT